MGFCIFGCLKPHHAFRKGWNIYLILESKQMTLEEKIESQQRLVDQIRELQKQEKETRAEILQECFGMDSIGTVKTMVGNLIVTGEYGLTYKFAQVELDEAIQKDTLPEPALHAIRVKYELDKKEYDKLDEESTNALNEYLTITPSLPSLKVKAE